MPRESTNGKLTSSVLKALDVLECLHDHRASLSPAAIAGRIGISRPTAYRLLATMSNRGWVVKDPQDPSKYRLGYRILQLAGTCLGGLDIRQVARPFIEQLSRQYDESVALFILDGAEVVYIDRVVSSRPLQAFMTLGERDSLHSKAVGKAILAYMPWEQAGVILRSHGLEAKTSHTITDIRELEEELARVRERGYGTADQEDVENMRGVGAAILNFQGAPIGGLAISALTTHTSDERVAMLGEAICHTAAQISEQLGCACYAPYHELE